MGRFAITSISNGSVIINVVIVPGQEVEGGQEASERSPAGMLSLLRSLQNDELSALRAPLTFFQNVDREYAPPSVRVVECADGEYRTICPYLAHLEISLSMEIFFFFASTLFGMIFLTVCCACVWRCDFDSKARDEKSVPESERLQLEPGLNAEFARSWLENRHQMTLAQIKKHQNSAQRKADIASARPS